MVRTKKGQTRLGIIRKNQDTLLVRMEENYPKGGQRFSRGNKYTIILRSEGG